MSAAPIFVVGANRSGTTLLRLILNAHPNIAIPEELIYFRSTMAGVPVEDWADPSLSSSAYEEFVRGFVDENCAASLSELDPQALLDAILSAPPSFRTPYRTALETWAAHYGKSRWGEKTPGNLFFADVLSEMFPDAKFIHLVRDSRAGVSSMCQTSFFSTDIVLNALNRRKYMTRGRDVLETLPPERRITLRYEDLVDDPESTVRTLCTFLEESFDPEMLQFYRDSDRYMKTEAVSSFNAAATRPISDSMVQKWRQHLSDAEIATIEWICADEMNTYGYAPTGLRLPPREWPLLGLRWAYWYVQVWKHPHIREHIVQHSLFPRLRGRTRALLARLTTAFSLTRR